MYREILKEQWPTGCGGATTTKTKNTHKIFADDDDCANGDDGEKTKATECMQVCVKCAHPPCCVSACANSFIANKYNTLQPHKQTNIQYK